jgi:hypothetical protein
MRVIAHDTTLGHRFENRDHFEYRKTLLVPEKDYPFSCEKLVAGDMILTVDYPAQKACLMHHPDMAKTERAMFEKLWSEELCKQQGRCAAPPPEGIDPPPTPVSPTTKAGSALREFFLSRSSAVTMGIFAVIAAGLTYTLYLQNYNLNLERIRNQARSAAVAAVPRFDAKDLDQLHTIEDIKKPEYAKVIKELNTVRWQQTNIRYAYILRPMGDRGEWTFIADADSMDPSKQIDLNHDGQITDADALNYPGQPYNESGPDYIGDSALKGEPYADPKPFTDQWGTWITGAAPVLREDKAVAGIVGVDIDAGDIGRLRANTFAPFLYFLGLFLLFSTIRFSAANRQLMREIVKLLRERKILISLGTSLTLALFATLALRSYTNVLNLKRIQDRVKSIAITGGALLHPEDLEALQVEEDWKKPEWAKVVNTLKDIRLMNEDILFVYVLRKDPIDPEKIVFVADSHSLNPFANVDNDSANNVDANRDGNIEPDGPDKLQWPGQGSPPPPIPIANLYAQPQASQPYEDAFGAVITGYAPLQTRDGHTAEVIAVDVKTSQIADLGPTTIQIVQYFAGFFVVFFFIILSIANPLFLKALTSIIARKRTIYVLIATALLFGIGIIAAVRYSAYREKARIGERLMTIAATAASQFDPADLNQLHKAGDMKTEAYQRVFKQLNEIRDANPGITYIYIMRPTDVPDVWEFVADADSNYDLPFWKDINNDGLLTAEDDENVWPGLPYISTEPSYLRDALTKPDHNLGNRDQWGYFISGSAPIIEAGKPIGIVEAAVLIK